MRGQRNPTVVVLGGPNGAGKSSTANALLERAGIDVFVNADVIAAELNAADPQAVAIEAGRIMLRRLRTLVTARENFAIESTLSGRSMQRLFVDLIAAAYDIELHYVWLPSAELSLERVRRRVELGGHNIPEADVRRRFPRSIENFYWIYRPMASSWTVLDGRELGEPRKVAVGHGVTEVVVHDSVIWAEIQRQVGDTSMSAKDAKRVREAAAWFDGIDDAIARADRDTILRHRAGGVPLVFWRDGKVVHVDPNTVELPEVPEHAGT